MWDSHPLALGATPVQVYIDGIPKIENAISIHKPSTFQVLPRTPNYDEERAETLKYDGLPPLEPTRPGSDTVLFTNVSSIYVKDDYSVSSAFMATTSADYVTVLAHRGSIQLCSNDLLGCASAEVAGARQIDLQGGSISYVPQYHKYICH
jgi:hypothetical protein